MSRRVCEWSDRAIIDWIEAHPQNAPHVGRDGKTWYITAHGNRECWGTGTSLRNAMWQVLDGTGPEPADK
jgi:hypothetical protein